MNAPRAALLLAILPVLGAYACAAGSRAQSATNGGSGKNGVGGAGGSGAASGSGGTASASTGSSGAPVIPCSTAAACSSLQDTCNVAACVDGNCARTPVANGTACDDGKYCTTGDSCQKGACAGGPPKVCPAPDACHVGTCDDVQMKCDVAPAADGVACDAGTACTSSDVCTNGTCAGTPTVACADGDGCCPMGCTHTTDNDCPLRVGVTNGSNFYGDQLRSYLATLPVIQTAGQIQDCTAAALQQYDVIVLYGNFDCTNDATAFNAFAMAGGGVIATPWFFKDASTNGIASDFAPVIAGSLASIFSGALDVMVTDPNDVLLTGLTFHTGDVVDWENGSFTLKNGATSSAVHTSSPDDIAVAKWSYEHGRSVYLNFQYLTVQDKLMPAIATNYGWGKQLIYNAVLWAARL